MYIVVYPEIVPGNDTFLFHSHWRLCKGNQVCATTTNYQNAHQVFVSLQNENWERLCLNTVHADEGGKHAVLIGPFEMSLVDSMEMLDVVKAKLEEIGIPESRWQIAGLVTE